MSRNAIRSNMRAAEAVIRELGGRVVNRRKSGHLVLAVVIGGRIGNVSIPRSPSDWRWLRNFRRDVRNIAIRGHPVPNRK